MKTEDFKKMEALIDSLRSELGHRCCLINGHHDGYYLGIYDDKTGELLRGEMSHSIEDCVKKLNVSIIAI